MRFSFARDLQIQTNPVVLLEPDRYANFVPLDSRGSANRSEIRLIGLTIGALGRERSEVPGLTKNVDANATIQIYHGKFFAGDNVADLASPPFFFGAITPEPASSPARMDPAGRAPATMIPANNGAAGLFTEEANDQTPPVWAIDYNVRRGLRKRWRWSTAIVFPVRNPDGSVAAPVLSFGMRNWNFSVGFSVNVTMDFATSPSDVA